MLIKEEETPLQFTLSPSHTKNTQRILNPSLLEFSLLAQLGLPQKTPICLP